MGQITGHDVSLAGTSYRVYKELGNGSVTVAQLKKHVKDDDQFAERSQDLLDANKDLKDDDEITLRDFILSVYRSGAKLDRVTNRLSLADEQDAVETFLEHKGNSHYLLTIDEFREALFGEELQNKKTTDERKKEIDSIVDSANKNGDSGISWEEFVVCYQNELEQKNAKEADKKFKRSDTDGNGTLSNAEVREALFGPDAGVSEDDIKGRDKVLRSFTNGDDAVTKEAFRIYYKKFMDFAHGVGDL